MTTFSIPTVALRTAPLLLAVAFAACGEPADTDSIDTLDGETDDSDTDTDDTVADDTQEPIDLDDFDLPAGMAGLIGTVVDETGAPFTSGRVQYCRTTCFVASTDDDGNFMFDPLPEGVGSFEVVPTGDATDTYATPFAPLTITMDNTTRLDVVVLPMTTAALPATGAAEVEPLPGLFLTSATDELTPLAFAPDATYIGAADALDDALPVEGVTGEILAMYYLSPFDYTADSGIPFRFENGWKAADGELEVYIGHYDTQSFDLVGTLNSDGAGGWVAAGGETLPRLATLLVVRPD